MSRVTVDNATSALRVAGAKAFPLGLSNPPPLGAGRQVFRSVSVAAGGFRDWLGPHDARVYRFSL